MSIQNQNFKVCLRQDNVFVENSIVQLADLANIPTRRGLEQAIISGGKIVNVVSNTYGHLPNENFFTAVEEKLIEADINYTSRSINREDRSFAVDYILNDERYHINVKAGDDIIKPMLRFTNSYDGSNKTAGHFGFFRQVCSNGLHVAQAKIGFSMKHRGNVAQIVLPEISALVRHFMDNEFYSLHKKFEVLAETQIKDVTDFVRFTLGETNLFKYEASEKNPEKPSANAQFVIDKIYKESHQLGQLPNYWLGYNAFNQILHEKLKKPFEQQKRIDAELFDKVFDLAIN